MKAIEIVGGTLGKEVSYIVTQDDVMQVTAIKIDKNTGVDLESEIALGALEDIRDLQVRDIILLKLDIL